MLRKGAEPIPGFRLERRLGGGSYGEVWKAIGPGGTGAALKFIGFSGQEGAKEFRAIQRVKLIRHVHLMPITGIWMLDRHGKLVDDAVVEQWAAGAAMGASPVAASPKADKAWPGPAPSELVVAMLLADKDLFGRLVECQSQGHAGIPRDELLGYMRDAAKGIDYLHSPQHDLGSGLVAIQHGDIKPQNIMLVGGSAVLCDFGLARVLTDSRGTTGMAGTPAYIAPECIRDSKPSDSSDQYSLAVTYVELRTGRLPFKNDLSYARVLDAHLHSKLDLSMLTAAEETVIRRATAVRPRDRFATTLEMVEALADCAPVRPSGSRSGGSWVNPLADERKTASTSHQTTLDMDGAAAEAQAAQPTMALPTATDAAPDQAPAVITAVLASVQETDGASRGSSTSADETLPIAPPDGYGGKIRRTQFRKAALLVSMALVGLTLVVAYRAANQWFKPPVVAALPGQAVAPAPSKAVPGKTTADVAAPEKGAADIVAPDKTATDERPATGKTTASITTPNRVPTVRIAFAEPDELVAGGALSVRLAGEDPDGDVLTYEFRTDASRPWQRASGDAIKLFQLQAGPLQLEARAVDPSGASSTVAAREWTVKPLASPAPAPPTSPVQPPDQPPEPPPDEPMPSPAAPNEIITNAIGMKLALIPAGEFQMGSPETEVGRKPGETQHRVRITRPFLMGVCEVTQAEYQKVTGLNPSFFAGSGAGAEKVKGLDTSRFPVETVSWDDAVAFCDRLSAMASEKAAGRVYHLPTEAQWEYACRAGAATRFAFGDRLGGDAANCYSKSSQAGGARPVFLARATTVGSYRPNAWGLYDMHGNVLEWCSDNYSEDYFSKSAVDDPKGPGSSLHRVMRGGSWNHAPDACRSASRNESWPSWHDNHRGFRVACERQ